VRIIAATNRRLDDMVREGTFRSDLYYRLNVIPIFLPPLRDRVEDIPLLTEHFMGRISTELGKPVQSITPEAMQVLMGYKWPGNVRELENIMERVITLMDSNIITVASLPSYLSGETAAREVHQSAEDTVLPWQEYEKEIIANALAKCGSFNAAGKMLHLTHKTVASKARKYGLVK
jgi:transcriptional regulator with PAS, ATPase and Fis domain